MFLLWVLLTIAFLVYAVGMFKTRKRKPEPKPAPVAPEREPWADHPITCRCIFHR